MRREVSLLDVANHAHDLVPRPPLAAPETNQLAHRILARKSTLRERLTDQHRPHRCRRFVALVEPTTPAQRNTHRLEVAWRHRVSKAVDVLHRSVRRSVDISAVDVQRRGLAAER